MMKYLTIQGVLILLASAMLLKSDKESIQPFQDGLISTNQSESNLTFSQSGDTLYFSRRDQFVGGGPSTILMSFKTKGSWSAPDTAYFSGKYSDSHPFISPDGQKFFFTSNRPTKGNPNKKDRDIWVMQRKDGVWSKPMHLGDVINSGSSEYSPTISLNGNLYFGSTRDEEMWGELFISEFKDGVYMPPTKLETLNSEHGEWGSVISPNEDYIIFESNGREDGLSYSGDLYISYFFENEWTAPKNIGTRVNTIASELGPSIHYQENKLFFSSNRDSLYGSETDIDIYSFDLREILETKYQD